MILSDLRGRSATPRLNARATVDELLHRAALRRPDALALMDAANRQDSEPRRLTYRQADRMASAIAGRLRRMGLHTDAIVAIQMANTVDNVLTVLGVLRAGLIPMPLPLLWRRAEMVAALSRVGATALIVSGRIGMTDHYELAMHVAAEIFPIRYVCGFGRDAPDGLVPFDDLFTIDKIDPLPAWNEERKSDPGSHVALITWDTSADGLVPVARSHAELIAGGLAVMLEGRLAQDAVLLSTLTLSSFANLAVAVIPWLLAGGTLVLHHPFDPEVYLSQLTSMHFDTVILTGPLATQLADSARAMGRSPDVIALWRTPERMGRALPWRDGKTRMTDVLVFGEIGLIAACRGAGGKPAVIPFGAVTAPRMLKSSITVAEIAPTPSGTVAVRGPMVPRAPFPPGAERSGLPHFKVLPNGFVDTGYACQPDTAAMVVTGPPPGMIGVGGYRFVLAELQDLVSRAADQHASVAVLPDALAGHRLSGTADRPEIVQASLAKLGMNPLVVAAFRERDQQTELTSQS
jgi:non-ribosomal peptide synthetase component E (peptide arylation enzyme)